MRIITPRGAARVMRAKTSRASVIGAMATLVEDERDVENSWSSRSTALTSSVMSGSSYGQPSEADNTDLYQNALNASNVSFGISDRSPLLFNGTKDTTFTVLQSWRAIIAVMVGPQRLWSTGIAATVAALCTLLAGYTLGYPSPALQQLHKLPDGLAIRNQSVLQDLFGALAPLGALFGGASAGWAVDVLGRKPALLLVALPNLIGWLMLALADNCTSPISFHTVLLVGRFITGFGTGWSLLSSPVYIAEVSPATLRGLYSALTQVALAFGILLVYCIGSIPQLKYTHVALFAVGITAVYTVLMVFLPETPRFLISKNKTPEATKVLRWLRGPKVNTDEERFQMQAIVSQERHMSCSDLWRELQYRSAYIPLVLMVFIMMFQQFCGINGLIFYAVMILELAGLGSNSPFIALFTIGLTELIFTLVTVFTMDLFGRKVLLIVSGSVMAASAFTLGITLYLMKNNHITSLQPLAVVCVLTFTMGFALGWGAVPWTLVSEIFPLQVHGLLGGVVSAVNWACAAIVSGFYFEYGVLVGQHGVWWTFGAINIIAVCFVAVFLPETKGKRLEIIEQLMQNRYSVCSWK